MPRMQVLLCSTLQLITGLNIVRKLEIKNGKGTDRVINNEYLPQQIYDISENKAYNREKDRKKPNETKKQGDIQKCEFQQVIGKSCYRLWMYLNNHDVSSS